MSVPDAPHRRIGRIGVIAFVDGGGSADSSADRVRAFR
jgi:hypothetical protein